MSVSYKLVIHNKNKILLKEDLSAHKFSDLTKFASDMVSITTNTLRASIISIGAQVEYAVISSNVRGFASLVNINKKFEEKINESEKLFTEAIPESVRNDVDKLFNLANPATFMAQRLLNASTDTKSLDMYIPFYWFTKYWFSGDFFKTDIEKFGLEGLFGVQFNNIIWYKGWLYRDVIFNNYERIQNIINSGALSRTNINALRNIKNMEDLTREFPLVMAFTTAMKMIELFVTPTLAFYDFNRRWPLDRTTQLLINTGNYLQAKKTYEEIKQKYGDGHQKTIDAEQKMNEAQSVRDELGEKFYEDMLETGRDVFENEIRLIPNVLNLVFTDGAARFDGLLELLWGGVVGAAETVLNRVANSLPGVSGVEIDLNGDGKSGIPEDPASSSPGSSPSTTPKAPAPSRGGGKTVHTTSHTLILKNNQLILKEESNNKSELNNINKNNSNIINDVKETQQLGLDKFQPNQAELLILQNIIDNKKISKYTKQWMELIKLTNQIENKSQKEKNALFLKMIKFSISFFDKIQEDLKTGFTEIQDDKSEKGKKINSELSKNFKFETNPEGFAKKVSFDFELLCNLNRVYSGSYLINVEMLLEQNNIIFKFLKNRDLNETEMLINNLKNNLNNKVGFILNNEQSNKKFEDLSKEISKLFDEKSRTYENFKTSKESLFKNLETNKKYITDFCDTFLKSINDLRKMSEYEMIQTVYQLSEQFITESEKNLNTVYNTLLPSLKELKNTFEIKLKNKKESLNNNFEKLLLRLDLTSFDNIYNQNKKSFDEAYNNCIKYVGMKQDTGSFTKNLNEIKRKRDEYKQTLEDFEKNMSKKEKLKLKNSADEKSDVSEKDKKASLKIQDDIKTLNPINIIDDTENIENEEE